MEVATASSAYQMGDDMPSVTELLAEWRAAERRWERHAPPDEVRSAAQDVIAAWAAYQDAALPADTNEFMLVADDDQCLVACTRGVTQVLGYDPADLIGLHIADIAAPDLAAQTSEEWSAFTAIGRLDGTFPLRAKDGRIVPLRYQARVHHPVPGFHVSRLWPEGIEGD